MLKYLQLTFFTFLCYLVNGQVQTAWTFAASAGGTYAADAQGNSYYYGSFNTATITLQGIVLTNSRAPNVDFYIAKYNPSGTILWARSGGSPFGNEVAGGMVVDNAGQIYLGCSSYGNAGAFSLGSNDLHGQSVFIAKLDAAGNYLWVKESNGGLNNYRVGGVTMDPSGNILFGGMYESSTLTLGSTALSPVSGGPNSFVFKLDPAGNVAWGSATSANDLHAIATDNNGNIYAALKDNQDGIFVGSTDVSIGTTFPGNDNIYLVKYNTTGSVQWYKTFGGNQSDYAFGLATDTDNNLYMTGWYASDNISFGPFQLVKNDPTYNCYLTKLNTIGTVQWVKTAIGRVSASVVHIRDSTVYMAGNFGTASVNFDGTVLNNFSPPSNENYFAAKYDTSGNFKWATSGGNAGSDVIRSLSSTADGYLVAAGTFGMPSIKFGNTTLTHSGPGAFAPFVARLDQVEKPVITGISNLCSASGIKRAKLLNPPAYAGFLIEAFLDGAPISYNSADSSIIYYNNNLTPGQHTLLVKYTRGTLSDQASSNFQIQQAVSPQVTIATTDTTFTAGQEVLFVASPQNGGTNPVYQWQVNNENTGNNNDTLRITGLSGISTVRVIMTSSLTCVQNNPDTSNTILMAQVGRLAISLNQKAGSLYNIDHPESFLSAKALEKRRRFNIPIDTTDLPVNSNYLDSIRMAGDVTITTVSKWLNIVSIQTTDAAAIHKINSFSFVNNIIALADRTIHTTDQNKFGLLDSMAAHRGGPSPELANIYNYGQSYAQVHIHQGEFLHNHGFSGQGMQLAMLDAGFPNYPTLPTFDSARINNQFLGTWDFVTNNANVNGFDAHGTLCLSTIAANNPGSFVGTAPKTSFYLFRTEDAPTEQPIEELNLAAALERADSLGVDIASISLGYTTFDDPHPDHTYADMNGDITVAARAADLAARKGMLVVAANGNDGNKTWHYLSTPADADSVLAVGAVNSSGVVGDFSSYGPSSDGQVKPGVAAVGVSAVVANASTGVPTSANGTSFACPNMSGLATCLWQAFPESNNMGIISALQESASIFNTPNNRIGYGIPDMKKAFVILLKRFYSQQIQQAGCNTLIKWTAKSSGNMNFVVERKLPADADFVPLQTINGTGSFVNDTFNFTDNLSALATPVNISYRIKMNIDTDTSFYFSPVVINHQNVCNTYTFTGSGNWNLAANWAGNVVPPATLPAGSTIIIDPIAGGECIVNITQQIQAGAYFEVRSGKKMTVAGNLIIQ